MPDDGQNALLDQLNQLHTNGGKQIFLYLQIKREVGTSVLPRSAVTFFVFNFLGRTARCNLTGRGPFYTGVETDICSTQTKKR